MVGAWTGDAIPKALPCKSFEPIGRHARIVRVTLQDCRLGRLGGPTPRNITLPRAWPLLAPHARHFVPYQQSEYEVNPPSVGLVGMPHEQAIRPEFDGIGTSLISGKSSLIRNDESLISQKNSLFTNVGNLPLSL